MRIWIVLLAAAVAGCIQGGQDNGADGGPDPEPPAAEAVRFLAIGDQGTGEQPQFDVAAAMKEVCDRDGCDFVLTMGDNIYEVGVTSPYDPQFETKFEQPYADFDIPFYMSLGNHDNAGVRSGHATGDFQVDYAKRTDRTSDKWQMPARWYPLEQGPVQFLALDTNLVFGGEDAQGQAASSVLSDDPDGVQQQAWVRETLAETKLNWTILYGHHPLFSNGEHGDEGGSDLGLWLTEAVCSTGQVDVFITGHDHDLQWLKAKPETCGDTQFLVSGAAAKSRSIVSTRNDAHFACGDTYGFAWIEIQGERMTARFYDDAGTVLYDGVYDRAAGTHDASATQQAPRCKYGG